MGRQLSQNKALGFRPDNPSQHVRLQPELLEQRAKHMQQHESEQAARAEFRELRRPRSMPPNQAAAPVSGHEDHQRIERMCVTWAARRSGAASSAGRQARRASGAATAARARTPERRRRPRHAPARTKTARPPRRRRACRRAMRPPCLRERRTWQTISTAMTQCRAIWAAE